MSNYYVSSQKKAAKSAAILKTEKDTGSIMLFPDTFEDTCDMSVYDKDGNKVSVSLTRKDMQVLMYHLKIMSEELDEVVL